MPYLREMIDRENISTIDIYGGGPGSGRRPSGLLKDKGYSGKFMRYTQTGREYSYKHPSDGQYRITHNTDERGAPTDVRTWSYHGARGRAKGKDQQSFESHLAGLK